MISISARIRAWLAAVACLTISPVFASAPEPVEIEAREPRAEIRLEILKGTKLGSSPDEVLKYIRANFAPKKDAPVPRLANHPAVGPTAKVSEKRGVKSIRLILGAYQSNPGLVLLQIPIVARTTTAVQWAFDKDGRLIEVFVDKDSELGDQKGPDD